MKKIVLFILPVIVWAVSAMVAAPPEAEISNGLIRARLYLPDPSNGYYRGSRFDWSGQIFGLDWKNHHYFGQWFKVYDPTLHDAIQGPVEAFDPIGYEQAKVGDGFVKIGIGVVTKTDDGPITFSKYYPIVNSGKWAVDPSPDRIKFTHTLDDKVCSYEYEKVVSLTKNKPELVISHRLRNTGSQPIETSVYNHNFYVMDAQPTGPGFTVTFPFEYTGPVSDEMARLVEFKGNRMLYRKDLDEKERVFFRDMTAGTAVPYAISIENHKTGAAVKITGDLPVTKFVFWSAPTTVCPEPYNTIKVNPGKEFSWTVRYEYYECGK